MEYVLTKAFVIKRKPLKEFNGVATLYSLDFGKIKTPIKGLYKIQSKISGHLDSLNLVNIKLGLSAGGPRLFSALTIDNYPHIKTNALKLKTALFLLRLIDILISEPIKDEKVFKLVLKTFNFLNKSKELNKEDYPKLKIWLTAKILNLLGYGESWRCFQCGRKLTLPVYYFQDGFYCRLHHLPKAKLLAQKDFLDFYKLISNKEFKKTLPSPPKFSWRFLSLRIRKIAKGLI